MTDEAGRTAPGREAPAGGRSGAGPEGPTGLAGPAGLAGLTRDETELLIWLRARLAVGRPEAAAGGWEWTTPEVEQPGAGAAVLCACGLWSAPGPGARGQPR